jgi:hypothetical protein
MSIFNRIGCSHPMQSIALSIGWVLSSLISVPTYAASYQLQPIYDLSPYDQDHGQGQKDAYNESHRSFIGGTFNYSMPQASMPDAQKSTGHYGFGLFGRQHFHLNRSHLLGYQFGFNASDKSSFAQFGILGRLDRQVNVSLYDVTALGQYSFGLTPSFSVGLSAGVGYVYGWVENDPAIGYYGRFEPVLGGQMVWAVTHEIALTVAYLHYFGVASERAYQSRQGAPSMDRLSIGVSYVF